MTNFIIITNYALLLSTNPLPVVVSAWETQTGMFIEGFSDAFPLALALGIVWAILASLRAGRFPTTKD